MTHSNPAHLFISYAVEDVALARWLAQKLAARGHPVWFDKMKPLGGEPWPHALDDAIKHRTFRMLALVSKDSMRKKRPLAEWTLAQRIARQRKVADFLIPLHVDDSEPERLAATAPPIPFSSGWASGWKALVKKLDLIKAPRSLPNGAQLAASCFPRGEDLTKDSSELLFANIIRVTSLPNVLRVFQAADSLGAEDREALEGVWTFYEIAKDAVVAFFPPPPEFVDRIRPTHEKLFLAEPRTFRNVRIRDIVGGLILKALGRRLVKAGCLKHPNAGMKETFFFPEMIAEGAQLESLGFGGKKIRIPIRGKVAFRRSGGVTEVNFHYFAFRLRLARGLDSDFYVQLKPTLVFFDEKGEPIGEDKNVQTRLRRITKTWDNEEWLNRIMAAEHVLCGSTPASANDPALESGLITLNSPRGLNEAALDFDLARDHIKMPGQELELDEPEAEAASE
jgi:TIR domain